MAGAAAVGLGVVGLVGWVRQRRASAAFDQAVAEAGDVAARLADLARRADTATADLESADEAAADG